MRHSPTSILHFLANHYTALNELFNTSKTSRIVDDAQLRQHGLYDLKSKLVDYKIIRPLQDQNQYRFEERYFDFLSFLTSDFSLDLPDQLAKYQQSLQGLFSTLEQAEDHENITFVTERLIEEIARFLSHLEDNTAALEQEVDLLRNAQKKQDNYFQQVKKASYLIGTFLEPLNLILDQHEDAIIHTIRRMAHFTHQRLLSALDGYEAAPYAALHSHLRMAEDEVQYHLSKLVDSLLPLLDQIKVGNQILKGLKILRDDYSKGRDELFTPFLPQLHDKRGRKSPYKYSFELAAENKIEEFIQQKPVLIHPTTTPSTTWYFRRAFYQQKLAESLPIDDFFTWCFKTLQQEEKNPVDLHKFFKIASLLFQKNLTTTSFPTHKTLQLDDTHITIPHIKVQPS